jgi:hypothetical protein
MQACIGSLASDFVFRRKTGYLDLSKGAAFETPIARLPSLPESLSIWSATLSMGCITFAQEWQALGKRHPEIRGQTWGSWWAVDRQTRVWRRAVIEALVARALGLDSQDLRNVFSGCDGATESLARMARTGEISLAGYWRLDREFPPEERITAQIAEALEFLERDGQAALLSRWRPSSGWKPPRSESGGGESWAACDAHSVLIEAVRGRVARVAQAPLKSTQQSLF